MRKRICLFLLTFCLFSACAPVDQAGMDSVPKPDASGEQHEEPDAEVPSSSEVAPVPEDDPVTELSARDQNWITDIHYLHNHYKTYHPDPFYLCPEEEFDWKIDRLCQKVNVLSDNDIFFELAAIIAGMGDTHTGFTPGLSLQLPFPTWRLIF